ncbi:MAG: hypothetical protein HY840_07425 [Bacteroidetes bacterium]|nr:hypothetical protein [Bacteroidota bacterium]
MINLEKFFTPIFIATHPVSNLNLKRFTEKHLAALINDNTGGKYDTIIALTTTAFTNYFGNVEDKDLAKTLLKSQTLINDNARTQFIAATNKHYNLIIYKYPQNTPEYLEFFPRGETEYDKMNKANALILMDRLINACTKYVTEITQPVVDEFTAARNLFNNSRSMQLQTMEDSDLESTEISETRTILEFQLNKNLLILATEYLGNVARGMDFFDQQYLGRTGTAGGGTPPPPPPPSSAIIITSNQSSLSGMPLEIIISGNLSASGGGILATWESGVTNSANLTAGGTIVFQHVYTATGIKTITVAEVTAGVFDAVAALQLPNVKATVITLDGDFSTTTTFNFYGNDLTLTNVYALITQINDYGTSGGMLNISGGTMPVPDPAFPALIALRSRGWMVTTN